MLICKCSRAHHWAYTIQIQESEQQLWGFCCFSSGPGSLNRNWVKNVNTHRAIVTVGHSYRWAGVQQGWRVYRRCLSGLLWLWCREHWLCDPNACHQSLLDRFQVRRPHIQSCLRSILLLFRICSPCVWQVLPCYALSSKELCATFDCKSSATSSYMHMDSCQTDVKDVHRQCLIVSPITVTYQVWPVDNNLMAQAMHNCTPKSHSQ